MVVYQVVLSFIYFILEADKESLPNVKKPKRKLIKWERL
jgi:hypothetical protein